MTKDPREILAEYDNFNSHIDSLPGISGHEIQDAIAIQGDKLALALRETLARCERYEAAIRPFLNHFLILTLPNEDDPTPGSLWIHIKAMREALAAPAELTEDL